MKCFSEAMYFIKKRRDISRGSISIEAVLIIPAVVFVMFLFVSFFQYISVYVTVYRAGSITAEYMSYYACVYYEEGISKIEDSIKSVIYDAIGEDVMSLSNELSSEAGDAVCNLIAKQIFLNELDKTEEFYINKLFNVKDFSFSDSEFFEDGNDFELCIDCKTDLLFPVPFFSGKGYLISVNIPGKGWMRGNNVVAESEELSVWSLDNLTRGRKIEEEFGSNLPYDYPTIDIYDSGSGAVTIIQSIDTTSSSYLKSENLTKALEKIYNRITNFSGTRGNSSVDEAYWIKAEDIKVRKILVVIPENELTVSQVNAIIDFTSFCILNNVQFSYERYQVSY